METTIKVNIDDYLSEEEKKEIAIDTFRNAIKNTMFKGNSSDIVKDSEIQRIVGNVAHVIVFEEVQKYIPDFKEQIVKKVRKCITEDSLSYQVFRKKDAWEKEQSLAQDYIYQTVREQENEFKDRIKNEMANFDLKPQLNDEVVKYFEELASKMYGIADLFSNNTK